MILNLFNYFPRFVYFELYLRFQGRLVQFANLELFNFVILHYHNYAFQLEIDKSLPGQ